jgi:hypothetical protein
MDIQGSEQLLICSWDFTALEAFPGDCASRGCRLDQAGLELNGSGAYVTLPVTMPPGVHCLKSRTMAVCVRFEQPQTGLIAIGLDDPDKEQHERLVFGVVNPDYDHIPFWRVDQAGRGHEPRRIGFRRSPMENCTNKDIHLVLVVQRQETGSTGVSFRCYRNGHLYGSRTTCSSAAEFLRDDQIYAVIKRLAGSGRTVVKHARVYGKALSEAQIKMLGMANYAPILGEVKLGRGSICPFYHIYIAAFTSSG